MVYKVITSCFCFKCGFYNYSNMTVDFDPNRILSKKEREERVLDLHFNQNKNYRQIAERDENISS